MKDKIMTALVVLSPALMLAQEQAQDGATLVGTAVESAVSSAATTLQPILITIITAGIGLWLVVTLPGILKRAWSSGKGR